MFTNVEAYLRLPFPRRPVFFDVGANRGQWFQQMVSLYPDCLVYAFEPIAGITPPHPNVILQNWAVDIEETRGREFYITHDDVTSSLLKLEGRIVGAFVDFQHENGRLYRKSDFEVTAVTQVETKRLDRFIHEQGIRTIHYLKIDVEGNDLNVFKSLGEHHQIVWACEVEVWNESLTLFQGSVWRDPVRQAIQSAGFTLVDQFVHGRGRSTDLLFVRNDLVQQATIAGRTHGVSS